MRDIVPGKRTLNPPLGLATLAALCPPHWEVSIVDENVESVPLNPQVDIVGVCGMGVQFARQSELIAHYRARGYFVVAGGSYASLCPEKYTALAHTTVAGEAEYIWPSFCRDFEAGRPQPLYRETGTVNLADSPVPALRPAQAAPVQHRKPAVFARLPVSVRFLRHHRHVRASSAAEERGADRPGVGRPARAGRAAGLLRRRQPDRQPRPGKSAAALPGRLPEAPQLALQLRHGRLAQPRSG
jgi:hypothetical protein